MKKTGIGIVGCGNISQVYFTNLAKFPNTQVVACADMVLERAQAKAAEHNVPKALTVEQLLADPDVEIVLNLTIPVAHSEIALAALEAGKHVYGEKTLYRESRTGAESLGAGEGKGAADGLRSPTRFSAGRTRPAANSLTTAKLANPLRSTPSCCVTVTSRGIPTRPFTTPNSAAGR